MLSELVFNYTNQVELSRFWFNSRHCAQLKITPTESFCGMLAIFYCILCLSWTCTMLLWDVLMILYLWNTFKNFEETTYHLNCYILKWYKYLFLLGASHAAHIFHVLYNIVFTVWPQYHCEYDPEVRWRWRSFKLWKNMEINIV